MKKLYLLLCLGLFSCNPTNIDKEKELLEKELALTKKELALKEKELEIKEKSDSISTSESNSKLVQEEPKKFVFSTDVFRIQKGTTRKILGKKYEIDHVKKQTSDGNPPVSTQTTFVFTETEVETFDKAHSLPTLKIDGDAGFPVVKDLNGDGKEELLFYVSPGNGTWGYISIYALSEPTSRGEQIWYSIGGFMRWAFSECEAKIYWLKATQELEISSDQMGDTEEGHNCNKISTIEWKII